MHSVRYTLDELVWFPSQINSNATHLRTIKHKECLPTALLKVRLLIRNTRQNFFAPCLFYLTVHRSRKNLRNPSAFTYITILVASSRAAYR